MAKGKRAGRGEGSIYQRKDKRWVGSFLVEETGKRKYFYGKTRAEVVEKLRQAQQEQKQGILATGPKQKLGAYLEQWFEEVHKLHLRKTTYIVQYRILHKDIIPALGHIQLQKLTTQQVQRFYTTRLQEGLAPGSVRNIHVILHNALENAVRWNLIARNPCSQVTLAPQKKSEKPTLTVEQAQHLLTVAHGHHLECLISLVFATGLRHGEMAALRWQDINFDERCLYVIRSVSRRGGIKGKVQGGYFLGEPKTESSKREVMLPHFVVDALKAHRVQQNEIRLKAGSRWQDRELVFCNRRGGFLHPDTLLKQFHALLSEAGLPPMRLHDLRHNIATLLVVKMKNPLKLAQDLLGHSGDAITNQVYTHSDPASLRKMTGLDNVPEHAARFTFAMARHAAVDLAQVFGTTPETLTTSRLSAEDFALLRRNLAEFGLNFRDGEAAETKLASLRSMYEPYVDALANHLLMPLPEWMPRNQVLDDWQTSIWDHFSLTSQRPLNKVR